MPIIRKRFITDRDGNEIEIRSKADLQAIIAQMTPEEKARFDAQYRFAPVDNDIQGQLGLWYAGLLRDLG